MVQRNPFGQYRYYRGPKKANESSGDVGLILPVLILIFVVGTGAALRWWKKKKEDEYEVVEEEIDVSPLEGSESLRAVERTIAHHKRKGKRHRY